MNASKPLALAMLIGITAFSALAQTPAEHAQHHPDGAAVPVQAAPATPEQQMSAMDKQLQLMRDMSRKLADAKTPQERQAVMAEHQKTMQDSMKMMGQMQGIPMGGMGMMSGQMMMGGAGMPGGSTTPPSAPTSGHSSAHAKHGAANDGADDAAPCLDGKAHGHDAVHDANDDGPPACHADQVTHPPDCESP